MSAAARPTPSSSPDAIASLFAGYDPPAGSGRRHPAVHEPGRGQRYRRSTPSPTGTSCPVAGVLDWGCGRGHFTLYLLVRGFRVTATRSEERRRSSPPSPPSSARGSTSSAGRGESGRPAVRRPSLRCGVQRRRLQHAGGWAATRAASLAELRRVLSPRVASSAPTSRTWRQLHRGARLARPRPGRRLPPVQVLSPRHHPARAPRPGLSVLDVVRYGAIPEELVSTDTGQEGCAPPPPSPRWRIASTTSSSGSPGDRPELRLRRRAPRPVR